MALGLDDGETEMAGLVDGVGVGKEQPFAAGGLRSGPDGVGLPRPAAFESWGTQNGHIGKAGDDGVSLVSGVVVDDDDFPIASKLPGALGLGDKRAQTVAEAVLFVAGGDDDGELELGNLIGRGVHCGLLL